MRVVKIVSLLLIILNMPGCDSKKKPGKPISIDRAFLDSIKSKSDTTYTKEYHTRDFAIAEYFLNRRDSTTTQLMKDTAGIVRQMVVARKNIRIYTAQYFPNGQLIAKLPLDSYGQFDGSSVYYYEDGSISSEGSFKGGLRVGEWKNYKADGRLVATDVYNENGQVVKTLK